MKKNLVLVALLVISMFCVAQINPKTSDLFNVNSQVVKVGVGLNLFSFPLELSYEKGIQDNIFDVDGLNLGVGGYLGYYGYKRNFTMPILNYSYSYRYTNIIIGARGLLHYNFVPKLDTYAGLLLGYNIGSARYSGDGAEPTSPKVGGIAYGGVLGARYEFNEKFGAYAEVGYSISVLSAGVAYKF
jgi:hypothetical protein